MGNHSAVAKGCSAQNLYEQGLAAQIMSIHWPTEPERLGPLFIKAQEALCG